MTKPYQNIKELENIIENLRYKLQYSKDKVKDAKVVNMLIDVRNSFNGMLTTKYKTSALNTLMYALIYEILMSKKIYKSDLPLNELINSIDTDIHYGSDLKKQQVISLLKTHELNNKIKNNSVFDKDYINFEELLDKLVNEFKQQIVWTLIK